MKCTRAPGSLLFLNVASQSTLANVAFEISIVVPVYNEEENVLPLAREVALAMQKEARLYELVFVDDASTDCTWDKILQARGEDWRVRGVRHRCNAGQSA